MDGGTCSFEPLNARSEQDFKCFGLIESYGGLSPDEIAEFIHQNLPSA